MRANSGCPVLFRLDGDKLARIFWKLIEAHSKPERQGTASIKILVGNHQVEVLNICAEEMFDLQNQGYLILNWNVYRKLLSELKKVIAGSKAEVGKAFEAGAPAFHPSLQSM